MNDWIDLSGVIETLRHRMVCSDLARDEEGIKLTWLGSAVLANRTSEAVVEQRQILGAVTEVLETRGLFTVEDLRAVAAKYGLTCSREVTGEVDAPRPVNCNGAVSAEVPPASPENPPGA